ncbi:MAG TPA: hypothetical protein DDY13_12860 [Cytophagales bacterium]|nr:hypothetical protein [Cytophagales bacterium]
MKNIRLLIVLVVVLFGGCKSREELRHEAYLKQGENLAKVYCATCHMESKPALLDKKTWLFKVLPKMGPRLGMHYYRGLPHPSMNPMLVPKQPAMEQGQWESIVDYFLETSPTSLELQNFDVEPNPKGKTFSVRPFTKDISSSSIITLLDLDTLRKNVFAGDVNNNILYQMDYSGELMDTVQLPSPPTSMSFGYDYVDLTLAGLLHPNNLDRGEIIRYQYEGNFRHQPAKPIISSLFRPVASLAVDFNYDGRTDYLVCEYGHNIGRLSIHLSTNDSLYKHEIIENVPGSIMVKTHDFNKDGLIDIAALFAQGDEKIMIYYNDGEGNFRGNLKLVARFPSVYGSMYIDLEDFNGDGYMDIIYVNGDNFDYSQILKPYHGIRILENDGGDNFEQKYFYPIYGAGKSICKDFDLDGDFDILVSSNFADMEKNPERGIIYLENTGDYVFTPFSFEESAQNQWNTMTSADFDGDGDVDVLIGAMNLDNVLKNQNSKSEDDMDLDKNALLIFENKTN